jgi:hypothetical protein
MFRILVVRSRRKVRWADYLLLRRKAVLGRARGNVGCAGWVRGDEGFGPFGRIFCHFGLGDEGAKRGRGDEPLQIRAEPMFEMFLCRNERS